jgi:isoamylase
MYYDALEFELPQKDGYRWVRTVDTSLPSPEDIADPGSETPIDGSTYLASDRSVVVLASQKIAQKKAGRKASK